MQCNDQLNCTLNACDANQNICEIDLGGHVVDKSTQSDTNTLDQDEIANDTLGLSSIARIL